MCTWTCGTVCPVASPLLTRWSPPAAPTAADRPAEPGHGAEEGGGGFLAEVLDARRGRRNDQNVPVGEQ